MNLRSDSPLDSEDSCNHHVFESKHQKGLPEAHNLYRNISDDDILMRGYIHVHIRGGTSHHEFDSYTEETAGFYIRRSERALYAAASWTHTIVNHRDIFFFGGALQRIPPKQL